MLRKPRAQLGLYTIQTNSGRALVYYYQMPSGEGRRGPIPLECDAYTVSQELTEVVNQEGGWPIVFGTIKPRVLDEGKIKLYPLSPIQLEDIATLLKQNGLDVSLARRNLDFPIRTS